MKATAITPFAAQAQALARSERATYRALLRLGRNLDRNPLQLVTLRGEPRSYYDARQQKLIQRHAPTHAFLDDALWGVLGCSTEYSHPRVGCTIGAIRRHRRRAHVLGLGYMCEAAALLRRLEEARCVALEVLAAASLGGVDPKTKESNQQLGPFSSCQLEPIPAQSSETPEVGELLLAHPLARLAHPILDQTVVLIRRVDKGKSPDLAQGIVLNRATNLTVRDLLGASAMAKEDFLFCEGLGLEPLLDSPLHRGGDHIDHSGGLWKNISWLHTLGSEKVPGARQIFPGIWDGGDLRALALLAQGGDALYGRSFRPFLGSVKWELEHLSSELERGIWARGRLPSDNQLVQKLCFGSVARPSSLVIQQVAHDEQMWRGALHALGLPALARFPRDRPSGIDEMLCDVMGAERSTLSWNFR